MVCVKGQKGRDPRGHVVTCAYYVKCDENAEVKPADDAAEAKWYPLDEMLKSKELAFDHLDILKEFVDKRNKGHFY